VSIWDMHTGRPVLSLRNATDPIDALMFVDDHTLLAANRFGITRRWSAGPIAKVLKRP
jgi:hypothetical protein